MPDKNINYYCAEIQYVVKTVPDFCFLVAIFANTIHVRIPKTECKISKLTGHELFLLAETDFFRRINEAGDCNMEKHTRLSPPK